MMFFSKCSKFNIVSRNRTKKNQEQFLLFKIIAFEPGSSNSDNIEEDTCLWQSICYQETQSFNMSLMHVYSKPGSLRVIKNIMKVLSCRIYKSLGPFNMLTIKGCSQTVFFRECSNQVCDSLYFPR